VNRQSVISVLDQLSDLLVPTACAGCSVRGVALCPHCTSVLESSSLIQTASGVWARNDRLGLGRASVKALKLGDERTLLPVIGRLLADSVARAVATSMPSASTPIVLVPVPRRQAARKQGRGDTVLAISQQAALALGSWPAGVHVESVATFARQPLDQRTLSVAGRRENLAGAMVARRITRRNSIVVAVDDVVTTGSTLAELMRALRESGHGPVTAAAVALTPLHEVKTQRGKNPNWQD